MTSRRVRSQNKTKNLTLERHKGAAPKCRKTRKRTCLDYSAGQVGAQRAAPLHGLARCVRPRKGCPARAVSGASGSTCVFAVGGLEVNLSSKLEDTRVEGRSNLSKVGGTQAVADLIEFGMVPSVEGFDAELEAAAAGLAEHKALEEREVPVVATRAAQRVVCSIAPRAHCWVGEGRLAEPLAGCVRVADGSDLIRSVGRVGQAVAALSAGELRIDRQAGCDGHDARDFPATEHTANEAVFVVAEERDVVDEVDRSVVGAIVAAGADIVKPAGVGVRNVLEVGSATGSAGADSIDRARQRVEGAQGQVFSNLRAQVNLQTVVVRVRFVGREVDGVEAGIRQSRRRVVVRAADESTEVALVRQVGFTVVVLEAVRVAYVGDAENGSRAELALDADAPLIARRLLVFADSQAGNAGWVNRKSRGCARRKRQVRIHELDWNWGIQLEAERDVRTGVVHVVALDAFVHDAEAATDNHFS